MGAGKTAAGRALAARLGGACLDLDARVAETAGCTIAELFAREGEAGFRARESAALEAAVASGAAVIACGGGVVLAPRNRELLAARCRVVWLEVEPAEAARRLARERPGIARPLLDGGDPAGRLSVLLAERRTFYDQVARWRIRTDALAPEAVAEEILRLLDARDTSSAPPRP
jgi:shikimate kinase